MRTGSHGDRLKRGLLGALLASSVLCPLGHGAQDQSQVLANIDGHRARQEFGQAMTLAATLVPSGLRARHEALLLYSARSYDISLVRAMEAIEGGDRDEQLLLTAVSAAIWVLDTTSAEYCQALLEERLEAMASEGSELYEWYLGRSQSTATMVEDLIVGDAETQAAMQRSKAVALTALGVALAGLFFARSKKR